MDIVLLIAQIFGLIFFVLLGGFFIFLLVMVTIFVIKTREMKKRFLMTLTTPERELIYAYLRCSYGFTSKKENVRF